MENEELKDKDPVGKLENVALEHAQNGGQILGEGEQKTS